MSDGLYRASHTEGSVMNEHGEYTKHIGCFSGGKVTGQIFVCWNGEALLFRVLGCMSFGAFNKTVDKYFDDLPSAREYAASLYNVADRYAEDNNV